MTYGELLAELKHLSAEQLAQPVIFAGHERRGGFVGEVSIFEEDQVNPTGQGLEPISAYPDCEDEVVVRAGTVTLDEAFELTQAQASA